MIVPLSGTKGVMSQSVSFSKTRIFIHALSHTYSMWSLITSLPKYIYRIFR